MSYGDGGGLRVVAPYERAVVRDRRAPATGTLHGYILGHITLHFKHTMPTSGTPSTGTLHGYFHQGLAHQGLAHHGLAHQGLAHQGLAHQGLAQQGLAHQGLKGSPTKGRTKGSPT
jgi:hypothetical protein